MRRTGFEKVTCDFRNTWTEIVITCTETVSFKSIRMSIRAKLAQEPVTFLFRKMWRFARGHRRFVVLSMGMFTIANIVLLANPLVFGTFLNEIQENGFGEHNVIFLILLLVGLVSIDFLFWIFHGPARIIEQFAAFRTEQHYRMYLLRGVLGLGLSWHGERDSGDTIDKVNKASEGLYDFGARVFLIIEVLVRVIGTTAVLLFFNVPVGIFTIVLIAITFVVIFQFDRKLIPQYKHINEYDNKVAARIFDGLSNITTVKVLNIEKPVAKSIHEVVWSIFPLFRANKKLVELKWFTGAMLFAIIAILPLIMYITYYYMNDLPLKVGTLSAMFLYLSNLIMVYFTFSHDYSEMIINKTKVQNAEPLESSFLTNKEIARESITPWQRLDVQNLTFSYEDAKHHTQHLRHIALSLSRGEKIALIGESGSGKTTFLKILHGMYPDAYAKLTTTEQGGAEQTRSTSFADINLKTTLVPQEPEVFSASIRENITLGLDYAEKDIFRAANAAEFTKVIERLPQGLESVINEKGVNLSGGQKQRLALTRAILFAEGKEIILLDESTSSVDPETEVRIYQNIFARFEGKTVLASIHKMNLLKYFDRIVMFSDGEVVDSGTFDELLLRNEKFKTDWDNYIKHQATT